MGGQHLDGYRPVQAGVGRFVDFSHPTGPDRGLDGIRAEAGAAGQGHGLSVKSSPIVGPAADLDNAGGTSDGSAETPRDARTLRRRAPAERARALDLEGEQRAALVNLTVSLAIIYKSLVQLSPEETGREGVAHAP